MNDDTPRNDNVVDFAPRSWYCHTKTLGRIFHLLRMCQAARQFGLISGPPGVGKSLAADAYKDALEDAEDAVLILRCNAIALTQHDLLNELRRVFDLYPNAKERSADLFHRIVDASADLCNPLLIVDEAQRLGSSIEVIRDLYDAGVAVVLIANPPFAAKLAQAHAKRGDYHFPQIAGRFGAELHIDKVDDADIDALSDFYGVKSSHGRELLAAAARRQGQLYQVKNLVTAARAVARDRALTADDLRRAAQMREGE